MRRLAAALVLLASSVLAASPAPPYGILLMAHGGGSDWNRDVMNVALRARRQVPVAVAFGMADADSLQRGVDRLEAKGVRKIVAVPLFVSSSSEVLDHTRFLLGLRDKPSEVFVSALKHMPRHAAMAMGMSMKASLTPIKRKVPILMTPALDDDPLLVAILAEHAKSLSRNPAKDTLIVIGHGPYGDDANRAWLAMLGRIAAKIGRAQGFKAALAATLRDDNLPAVKGAAIAALRAQVAAAAKDGGRAVVVPDLIAREGIESHVVEALSGLTYSWDARTVLPHPNVARWVSLRARAAAGKQ